VNFLSSFLIERTLKTPLNNGLFLWAGLGNGLFNGSGNKSDINFTEIKKPKEMKVVIQDQ
jgi:hypothetical protein